MTVLYTISRFRVGPVGRAVMWHRSHGVAASLLQVWPLQKRETIFTRSKVAFFVAKLNPVFQAAKVKLPLQM